MRNLKKILALVLALVMSLSLMATASATDFKDDDQFTESYKVAAEVLEGLGVLRGDPDGSFRPTGSITRAEAAAAVYRIVTGDVEDKQVGIYADYNIFTDVKPGDWYAGYVNFCANAEYIKGNGDGTFSPNEQVNGYAALAMILRAIGYTANGGFTGDDWHIQAARTAEARTITKNILTGTLGADATRETVAEILFQAILVNMVSHNQDNTYNGNQGYYEIGETLGHKIFGLEKISGVVMANEWANLKTNSVLSADTTLLSVTDAGEINSRSLQIGDEITLDQGTDLAAVGMTYDAYVSGSGSSMTALTLTESDVNKVAFNEGDSVNTGLSNEVHGSILDLAKTGGMSSLTDAEYYIDYQKAMAETATSEWLIRYAIAKDDVTVNSATYNFLEGLMGSRVETRTIKVTNLTTGVASDVDCYLRSIRKGETITAIDLAVMEHIFDTADRVGDNTTTAGAGELRDYVRGEVYVGTSSLTDQSDLKSWREFQETYLVYDEQNIYNFCDMGDSLRVIDNDGDGVADYVLKVQYVQAKAIDTIDDALVLSNGLRVGRYSGNKLYCPDELALNDIVNYNVIDGKLSIWKADMVNGKITAKSFKDITVTVDGGETYDQSAIDNATGLQGNILNMTDTDEYNMYLDEFGNIRTYELALGTQYALLTEMYPTSSQNSNYVTNNRQIVEMKAGDGDREEHLVSNLGNMFYSWDRTVSGNSWINDGYVWTSRTTNANGGNLTNIATRYNYLQPAIAHLGYNGSTVNSVAMGVANNGSVNDKAWSNNVSTWNRTVYQMVSDTVFDYGMPKNAAGGAVTGYWNDTPENDDNRVGESYSFTNVAAYVMDGEEVILNTASKNHVNTNNEQVYRSTVPGLAGQVLGQIGTAQEWKDWYRAAMYPNWATMSTADRNTAATAIETWWTTQATTYASAASAANIYPVYATDYVQLVTNESYNPGDRHFTIAPTYANKYNTLSNTYVDATNETEFYIVTPSTIHHVVGFMNLLAIDASQVRAAYAVAQNTSRDQVGQDYWVADVIVIEVSNLTYDFDSIALMYYNPDEISGSVLNVNSLNNSWRVLQPGYDGKAMMNVTPGGYNWRNSAWIGGRFYAQYDTSLLSEGNLTAGDINPVFPGAASTVTPVNSNYSAYGIYAGEVSRIQSLVGSNYIDVLDSLGNHHYVNVRSADYNTPVYRITTSAGVNTANVINLTGYLETSDVQPGDRIIWVYRHDDTSAAAVKQAAYIVDVAPDTVGTVDWYIPSWLNNDSTSNPGLWQQIIADQESSNTPSSTSLENLMKVAENVLENNADDLDKLLNARRNLNNAIQPGSGYTFDAATKSQIDGLIADLDTAIGKLGVDAAIAAAEKIVTDAGLTTADVATQFGALRNAIRAASPLSSIYNVDTGKFVESNTAYQNLMIEIAKKVAANLTKDLPAAVKTDAGVTSALSTLTTGLASPTWASDSANIKSIVAGNWKDTTGTTKTNYDALQVAIAKAQINANAAAQAGDYAGDSGTVDAALAAVNTAITSLATSDLAKLQKAANGDYSEIPALKTAMNDLAAAIEAAKTAEGDLTADKQAWLDQEISDAKDELAAAKADMAALGAAEADLDAAEAAAIAKLEALTAADVTGTVGSFACTKISPIVNNAFSNVTVTEPVMTPEESEEQFKDDGSGDRNFEGCVDFMVEGIEITKTFDVTTNPATGAISEVTTHAVLSGKVSATDCNTLNEADTNEALATAIKDFTGKSDLSQAKASMQAVIGDDDGTTKFAFVGVPFTYVDASGELATEYAMIVIYEGQTVKVNNYPSLNAKLEINARGITWPAS